MSTASYQAPPASVKLLTWDESRRGWLALASFDGFGSRTLHKLNKLCAKDGARAWHVTNHELHTLGCTDKAVADFSAYHSRLNVDELVNRLERENIAFLLFEDQTYPSLLRQIADPPLALFVRGQIQAFSTTFDGIAIVGTRSLSPYGRSVTTWLARDLSQAGFAIVSGLAGGIDTVAHEATVDAGGKCIAVLGSGVDDVSLYPRCNLNLAKRILSMDGSILSEFPPGTQARKYHFPLRNRIIAGLCRATIVVEAGVTSGSLITAHLALEQNREVFAVPGSILNLQSYGTNRLLKLGAIPCTMPQDVIELLTHHTPPTPLFVNETTPAEHALLDLLSHPMHVNDIARALQTPVATVSGHLVSLELKGLALPQGGQIFARTRFWTASQN